MPNDYRRYNLFNKYLGKPSITYRVKQLKNTHRTLVLKYQHTFTAARLSDPYNKLQSWSSTGNSSWLTVEVQFFIAHGFGLINILIWDSILYCKTFNIKSLGQDNRRPIHWWKVLVHISFFVSSIMLVPTNKLPASKWYAIILNLVLCQISSS